jgi:hypothetical protein
LNVKKKTQDMDNFFSVSGEEQDKKLLQWNNENLKQDFCPHVAWKSDVYPPPVGKPTLLPE